MTSFMDMLARIQAGSLTPVFVALLDTALKGLVLIAVAAVAAHLLRKKSAAARHAVWTAAVIGHLALPVVTLVVPQWRIPLLPAPGWLGVAPSSSTIRETPLQAAPSPATSEVTSPAPPAAPAEPVTIAPGSRSWPAESILGMLWILGTTLVLLRLAVGTWKVGRLAKHGDRVDDGEWLSLTQRVANRLGITRPLTLLRGDSLAVPVTWGVVYPAVLLPPEANDWPESRRRFVLVHEMAHVKRFDALTQLVAQITLALLWFDPFLWYAAHRMRVEREHACDDYVLRDGTVPSLYAGELLEMVRSIGSPSRETAAPAFAALAMARRSEFEGRMLAILDSRQERKSLGRRSAVIAMAALALVVLPLAALRPFEASAAVPVIVQAQMPAAVTERAAPAAADSGIARVLPEAVRETAVDAPGKLSGSSSDLKAVMAKPSLQRNAETASARIRRQYPSTEDPAMILLALQGAKEMSSDTDRRILLQTVAERALGKRNATLRRAFFAASAEMTSDTDLRVVLLGALPFGKSDPEVTIATFRAVGSQMTSDTDKRVVLTAAAEQKLLRDSATREAFMVAARTIESSTDFTIVMQAALK